MFDWMVWTLPTAVFFCCIGLMLAGMTAWELVSPNVARRGFLPLTTTRGDRLFIGLLGAGYANLAWAGLTDIHQWGGAALGLVVLLIVMRWG
jgi:predicted small integral membrane protein